MTDRTCRSDYLELVEARLIEIQANVYSIKTMFRNEIAKGGGCDCEQLLLSRNQVEHFMTAVRQRLDDLKTAEDENWETAKDAFESAWEDFAHSIRRAVARSS